MNCVSETERRQAVADVRAIILASGQHAVVMRAVPGEPLYGADDAEYATVGTIPVECVPTPPEELAQKIDGTANVLPEADVLGKDQLTIGSVPYRVQSVREERWFGVVTHKVVSLVQLHGR
ncbi:MAG TPA: hypothetical protein VGM23_02025 [Armatimonadota bacterium]|jgi:hypothetical protein